VSRDQDIAEVEIRPLREGDVQRLEVFFASLGERSRQWFHPHGFDAEAARMLASTVNSSSEQRYLMIRHREDQEHVVGYGFLMRLTTDMPELGIAIADHAHGRGYGERMMRHLIETGRQLGKRGIKLVVYDDNLAARRLYRRCGFTTRQIVHHMEIVFDKDGTCAS
jgi:ribosomal protein S18 acetylase RimI-like enzyme